MVDPHILIVEGNTAQKNAEIRAQGGQPYAEVYRSVLQSIAPGVNCSVARPCEESLAHILGRLELAGVDGAVWTGSSLNAYSPVAEVSSQIDLFARLFDAGVPIFGSCWGLQVMATALGGKVRRNPWGREIGVARDITLTPAGAAHPMYAGKPPRFDAIGMHVDDIEVLPSACVVLAANAASEVQAAVLDAEGRSFWGVQYHPEFDLRDLALGVRRSAEELISEGFFGSPAELEAVCESLQLIEARPEESRPRRSVYGIGDGLLDARLRRCEIANWVERVARPRGLARQDASAAKAAP